MVKNAPITEFRGEFAFLSNFYLHPIEYEGRTFGSVEAAFQSAKCLDQEEKAMFTSLAPYEAKYVGRRVKLRPDWNEVKDEVMFNLVMSKFNKNPDLKKKLLETGDAELIEGNYWHDNYWGACSCRKCANKTKRNQLGKTLSGVRTWLRFQF